jgi:predicted neutral ceramidase superfamily lipid hydrolase
MALGKRAYCTHGPSYVNHNKIVVLRATLSKRLLVQLVLYVIGRHIFPLICSVFIKFIVLLIYSAFGGKKCFGLCKRPLPSQPNATKMEIFQEELLIINFSFYYSRDFLILILVSRIQRASQTIPQSLVWLLEEFESNLV